MLGDMFNDFLQHHWFNMAQTIFLALSFYLAVRSSKDDKDRQRIDHLYTHLEIYQKNREILAKHPKLISNLKRTPTKRKPVTDEEYYFVQQTIFQLYITFEAIEAGHLSNSSGLQRDIQSYFNLSIPKAVWKEAKKFHEEDFVDYVEEVLSTVEN